MNRDEMRRNMDQAEEFQAVLDGGRGRRAETMRERLERAGEDSFGSPEELITHAVDVHEVLDRKREAMKAHASQIAPDSFFLAMPSEVFALAFGTEWFIARRHHPGAGRSPSPPPCCPPDGGQVRSRVWVSP